MGFLLSEPGVRFKSQWQILLSPSFLAKAIPVNTIFTPPILGITVAAIPANEAKVKLLAGKISTITPNIRTVCHIF